MYLSPFSFLSFWIVLQLITFDLPCSTFHLAPFDLPSRMRSLELWELNLMEDEISPCRAPWNSSRLGGWGAAGSRAGRLGGVRRPR